MVNITVSIKQKEFEILESWLGVGQVQPWLQHAIDEKCRLRIDASISEHSVFNPSKIDKQAKLDLLKDIKLSSQEERDQQ